MTSRATALRRTSLAFLLAATVALAFPEASAAATCQSWSGSPAPVGTDGSTLADVAVVSVCRAYAVGQWLDGTRPRMLIERWNGSRWNAMDVPAIEGNADYLQAVSAVSANDVWAVGVNITDTLIDRPLAMHWNGNAWTRIPTPAIGESRFDDVFAFGPNNVWAVGSARDEEDVKIPLVERWNGTRWKVVPVPDVPGAGSDLFGIHGAGPDDIWAVGRRSTETEQFPLTMHWNGSAWRTRQAPTIDEQGHELHDVVVLSRTNAWAVGTTFGGATNSILLRWNGTEWKARAHPNVGEDGGEALDGLAATSADNIWAVGRACEEDDCASWVLHFDGSAWTRQPSASPGDDAILFGVDASSPSNAWAVGLTRVTGGDNEPFAIHCC